MKFYAEVEVKVTDRRHADAVRAAIAEAIVDALIPSDGGGFSRSIYPRDVKVQSEVDRAFTQEMPGERPR